MLRTRRALLRWSAIVPVALVLGACASPPSVASPVSSPPPSAPKSPASTPAPSAPVQTPTLAATRVPEATRTPVAPIVSPTAGGMLRWLLVDEPVSLNPATATTAAQPTAWSLALFRGLTRLDPSRLFQPLPDLATSWQASPDGLTYTFTLRDGVKWHDGSPFTADDVKFTLDLIRDPANGTRAATDFNRVQGVDVVDPATVRVRLSQPLPSLPTKLAIGVVPKHLLDGQDLRSGTFAHQPVGTGPFKLVEWRPGDSLTLDANADFYSGRPTIDRITFLFGSDPAAQLQRLQNGDADGATLPPAQARQIAGSATLELLVFKTASIHAIGFNARLPLFADPRARQAIQRGIDRAGIAQTIYGGLAMPASGPFVGTPFDAPRVNQGTDDPTATSKLMTALGWKRNASGIWEKAGAPFAFDLSSHGMAGEAQAVVDSLNHAGFAVTLAPANASGTPSNAAPSDTWLETFGSPVDPDSVYATFSSRATVDKGGFNLGGYADAQVDAALESGRTAADDAGRHAAYLALQTRLVANPARAFIVSPNGTAVVSKTMRGAPREIVALGEGFFFWNVEKWARE